MNWMGTRTQVEAVASSAARRPRTARSWFQRSGRTDAVETPSFDDVAAEAVASFREQALGMRCGVGRHAQALVRVVVCTGPVPTDPARLEIWVLLGDVDDAQVPPHWDPTEVEADLDLTIWALHLRATALGHLAALDWPDVDRVTVRFDTAERVERLGGRRYVSAA
ncbi:MAG: hypothetical protein R2713_19405 [Ilumatobacteraceae bacterium]|nr:hypothetical protein [Acidimicrobiales bacterium]MCB9392472.1 hypothetical protein [Acidimicrobiaceae bacterium]